MNQGLTLSAYAKHRGCALRAVQEAISSGRITARKDGWRWVIDPRLADEEWERNTNPARTKSSDSYNDEKTALARTQRLLAELKLAEEEGRLVDAAAVERGIREKQAGAVALLMSLPEEVGPRVAVESDPAKVIAILEAEVRRVCALVAGVKAGK